MSKFDKCMEWVAECDFISETVEGYKAGCGSVLKNFNSDLSCFIRYCEMQRDSATREGFHDSAEYIQQCIDDVREFDDDVATDETRSNGPRR